MPHPAVCLCACPQLMFCSELPQTTTIANLCKPFVCQLRHWDTMQDAKRQQIVFASDVDMPSTPPPLIIACSGVMVHRCLFWCSDVYMKSCEMWVSEWVLMKMNFFLFSQLARWASSESFCLVCVSLPAFGVRVAPPLC